MYRQELLTQLEPIVGRNVTIDEGLSLLIKILQWLIDRYPELRIVLLIAGGTGSGKTSLGAGRLLQAFPMQAILFQLDMFYRGKKALKVMAEQHGRTITWDEPLAVDLDAAARQLERLRRGEDADIPIYDFENSERVGMEKIPSRPIIIAEGLFALHDTLRQHGDLCVYIDVDIHGQIIRRTLRDIVRKKREGNDILLDLAQTAIPMQFKHVTTTRQYADVVIVNDYRPETETLRNQGLGLPQVKVAGWPPVGRLAELGAEYLGTLEGYDRYFTAKDRDLAQTGEELRIRDESGRLSLTYKGPHQGSVGERFVFTCSIEETTVQALMQYYREAMVYVWKSRRLFLLPGVLVSLDTVILNKPEGDAKEGAPVTEVRLTGHRHDGTVEVEECIRRLGLDPSLSTPASYFNIALNPLLLPTT